MAVLFTIGFELGRSEQPVHSDAALRLQPAAHGAFNCLRQCLGLCTGHDGHKAVGQCRSEQGVGVSGALRPFTFSEEIFGQAAVVTQPQVHLWHTAQTRKQDGIGPERFAHRFHGLPSQACQEVRTSPEVRGAACRLDETLYRSQRHRQQRCFAIGVGGEGPRKS